MIEKRLNDKGKNYRHVAKVLRRNVRNADSYLSLGLACSGLRHQDGAGQSHPILEGQTVHHKHSEGLPIHGQGDEGSGSHQ